MPYDFLKVQTVSGIAEIKDIFDRESSINARVLATASEILENIRISGEKALFKYCRAYDGVNADKIEDIKVPAGELARAKETVPQKYPALIEAIETAIKNLEKYHYAQLEKEPKSWYTEPAAGKKLGQLLLPVERVGLYIPGGRFLYPSSILMAAIPARIAGVKEIAVCTPPGQDGKIEALLLYIFSRLGINEIYSVGGAQAVALFAYGTENIKKVDKIAGPGNVYVTAAKKIAFGSVGIDSLAGPSEVLIIADSTSDPSFISSDLLSQAEHDPDSSSILLATDVKIAEEAIKEIYCQLDSISSAYKKRFNKDAAISALKKHCRIIVNKDMDLLIEACNIFAPEHLELMVKDPEKVLSKIKNAGAIFIGNYTPVAAGDYICGTNHVIPTAGNARFSSPLGVYDFFKKSSVAYYSREALKQEEKHIRELSDFENLLAHKNSIEVRFKK